MSAYLGWTRIGSPTAIPVCMNATLTAAEIAVATTRARKRIASTRKRTDVRAATERRLAACKSPAKIVGIFVACRTLKGLRPVAVAAKARFAALTGESLKRTIRAAK